MIGHLVKFLGLLIVPLSIPVGSIILYRRLRRRDSWHVPAGYVALGMVVGVGSVVSLLRLMLQTQNVNPADRATILAAGLSELMGSVSQIGTLLIPFSVFAFFLDRHLRRQQKPAP